jgi:hypothetical protein
MATKQELEDVDQVLRYTARLARDSWRDDHAEPTYDSEPIAEAVLLCAGKVQELVAPDSAHWLAVQRIMSERDIGSIGTLHRVRGVLKAAALIDTPVPD